MNRILFALFCGIFIYSTPSNACNFCMLAQGLNPYLTTNGKGITLDLSYRENDRVYNKSEIAESNGKKEAWTIYSLTGFYSFSEDFTLLATLPYVSKTNIDFDDTTQLNTGTLTTGIGDPTLTGRYTLIKRHQLDSTFLLGVLAGMKLPLGSTNDRDRSGNPVDRHALPGTGSIDFDIGLSSAYTTASGFEYTVDAVYRISNKGKWASREHQYGNMLNYSVKSLYRVAKTEGGASFFPFLGVSGETTEKEKGSVDPDSGNYDSSLVNPSTGGTVLFGDIGLHAPLSQNVSANLGFSKAFYHHMNFDSKFDADPADNYKYNLTMTYLF